MEKFKKKSLFIYLEYYLNLIEPYGNSLIVLLVKKPKLLKHEAYVPSLFSIKENPFSNYMVKKYKVA